MFNREQVNTLIDRSEKEKFNMMIIFVEGQAVYFNCHDEDIDKILNEENDQ